MNIALCHLHHHAFTLEVSLCKTSIEAFGDQSRVCLATHVCQAAANVHEETIATVSVQHAVIGFHAQINAFFQAAAHDQGNVVACHSLAQSIDAIIGQADPAVFTATDGSIAGTEAEQPFILKNRLHVQPGELFTICAV